MSFYFKGKHFIHSFNMYFETSPNCKAIQGNVYSRTGYDEVPGWPNLLSVLFLISAQVRSRGHGITPCVRHYAQREVCFILSLSFSFCPTTHTCACILSFKNRKKERFGL